MGNNQSNERKTNCKIFKITGKDFSGNSFDRFYLDDYVTYKDGNYKYIDVDTNFLFRLQHKMGYEVGEYCSIDQETTRCENSSHTFESYTIALVERRRVVEKVDSNGNIIRDVLGFISGVGEMIEERQQHIARIEYGRHANNHA